MKKMLSLLIVCVLMGCGENRVLIDDLINKGSEEFDIWYFEDVLFSGEVYDVTSDGTLILECEIKDGKYDGVYRTWYENGQLYGETNYSNGKLNGIMKSWLEDGQLFLEDNYVDGELTEEIYIINNGWNWKSKMSE